MMIEIMRITDSILSIHFFFLEKKTCAKRKSLNSNSTTNLSSSFGILLLLTYAPKASETVNMDRTIRIGDKRIPKHFFFLQKKTCAKRKSLNFSSNTFFW